MLDRYKSGFCSTLEDVFRDASRSDIAHVCVDPQRNYVVSQKDHDVIDHIGKSLAPTFREMGIPNYWVYMAALKDRHSCSWNFDYDFLGPEESAGGFCDGIVPLEGEKLIPKVDVSAFDKPQLEKDLKKEKKQILLFSGFTFWVCVSHSVFEARRKHGFKTVLLSDATDFDPSADEVLDRFNEIGVVVAKSDDVLPVLRELRL